MVEIGMSKIDLEKSLRPLQPVRIERVEAVCFYARNDTYETVWAVLDFMDFNLKRINEIREEVHNRTGIEPSHIHILTTHNHGGGEPDNDVLAMLVSDCVLDAKKSARKAYMKYAICDIDKQISIVRRKYIPEINGVTTLFYGISEKTNFDASPHIEYKLQAIKEGRLEYTGSTETERSEDRFESGDKEIVAIQFVDECDKTIGSVVRFAAHAVCSNKAGSFSSDYPWHIRRKMSEKLGGVAMFLNGPCADIAPGVIAKDDGTAEIIGEYIADTALKGLSGKEWEPINKISDSMNEISLKVRDEVRFNKVELCDSMPVELPQRLRYLERKCLSDTLPFLQDKYANGEKSLNDSVKVRVGYMQINNLYFVAFPGETFSGTAKALKEAFPEKDICTVTEHDRTVMYMPPISEYELGGYETTCMMIKPGEEEALRKEAIKGFVDFVAE